MCYLALTYTSILTVLILDFVLKSEMNRENKCAWRYFSFCPRFRSDWVNYLIGLCFVTTPCVNQYFALWFC